VRSRAWRQADYQHALQLLQAHKGGLDIPDAASLKEGERPLVEWQPAAMLSSTVENPQKHMKNIWKKVLEFEAVMTQPFPRSIMAALHASARGKHASVSTSPASSSPATSSSSTRSLCGDPTSVTDIVLQQQRLERDELSTSASSTASRRASCTLAARRALQRQKWMWHQLNEELLSRIRRFPLLGTAIEFIECDLALDYITPRIAAEQVLNVWLRSQTQSQEKKRD
jgi:hypothetical protein